MWDKSTAQNQNANETPEDINADMYRIEYSNTGPAEGGYNWQRLGTANVLTARMTTLQNDRQSHTDGYTTFPSGTRSDRGQHCLHGGDTRHYRVFALQGTTEMSWPSVQKSGTTAKPLQPGAPTALSAVGTGHTTIELMWTRPDYKR